MGMLGVAIIFFWGPPLPDFSDSVGFALERGTKFTDGTTAAGIIDEIQRRKRRHQIMSSIGLGLIFLGFMVQLIAVWN